MVQEGSTFVTTYQVGKEVSAWARLLRADAEKLRSSELPSALLMNAFEVVGAGRDTVQVVGYSAHDPLALPRGLVDVLHLFDGRDTATVVQSISAETGLEIDARQIRLLVDFRILVPAR